MVTRYLEHEILNRMFKGKAIIVSGARQVGKTTLINSILSKLNHKVLTINGDEPDVRTTLSNPTSSMLRSIIGKNEIVFIDEAQRITNIGVTLKLITDQIPDVQVIATGSSVLELHSSINEPLTGRKYEFFLHPLSFKEMVNEVGLIEEKRKLKDRLLFGSYPEIVTSPGDEVTLLKMLAGSYLYKDLLSFDKIRKPELLEKILQALALQVGNEVSYREVGEITGSDKNTVEKYINLLEKAYVLFRLPAYSKNIRNEIRKGQKVYFYDNGIRNAVIGNFSALEFRTDKGALWENYLISERKKFLDYNDYMIKRYFWRTTQQRKIDYLEESNNNISAYEFKWKKKEKWRLPKPFLDAYSPDIVEQIHKDNYYHFLGID